MFFAPLPLTVSALFHVYRVILDFSSVVVGFAATLTVSRAADFFVGVIARWRKRLFAVWAAARCHLSSLATGSTTYGFGDVCPAQVV
jgi:hypothetical protein